MIATSEIVDTSHNNFTQTQTRIMWREPTYIEVGTELTTKQIKAKKLKEVKILDSSLFEDFRTSKRLLHAMSPNWVNISISPDSELEITTLIHDSKEPHHYNNVKASIQPWLCWMYCPIQLSRKAMEGWVIVVWTINLKWGPHLKG